MKLLEKILFSTRSMTIMLFIYAISMAVATFVENDFGTPAAKEMIYYSMWFNLLQVLLIINFIFNIKRYKLWRKEKWSTLLFHLAFVFIFIGAAYTHLISTEGMMTIREGETSNEIISSQTYMKMNLFDQDQNLVYETPYQMTYFNKKDASWPFKRTFTKKYQFKDKIIQLKSIDYIPLAKDTMIQGQGKPTLELVTMGQEGRKTSFLQSGDIKEIGGAMFSFNNPIPGTIQIIEKGGQLLFKSPLEGQSLSMQGQQMGMVTDSASFRAGINKINVDSLQPLEQRKLYQIGPAQFVLPKPPFKGKLVFKAGNKNNPQEQENSNVVILEYDDGQVKDTLILRGGQGSSGYSARKTINGVQVSLGFGSKIIKTPFGMKLRDFQLDTYPGSSNPASFASEISVIDKGKEKDYRIYMNNVLDYGGYRFFQSGYDPDELGTRLSVNQDMPGTIITYIGYFMLFIGMFFTLFWKGSRFTNLHKMLTHLGHKNYIILLFLFTTTLFANAQETHIHEDGTVHKNNEHEHTHTSSDTLQLSQALANVDKLVSGEKTLSKINFSPEHIEKMEHLLIQDDQGRIKPLSTHALELLRKVYKDDTYYGLPATTWFLSVQQDPSLWASASLIRVKNDIGSKYKKELGVDNTGHTSLLNMIDLATSKYKLSKEYAAAFRKKPVERTKMDNEIINVTERFTILDNIAKGYYLKMIPLQNDAKNTWTSWVIPGEELEIDTTALRIFNGYFNSIVNAQKTGNWQQADKIAESIDNYQQKWGKEVVPSKTKVEIEVFYNHFNPFFYVMKAYSIVGTILLTLAFIKLLYDKKWVTKLINITLILTLGVFLVHALGLGLRWYISGHAPWTNGYEAVVFISWVGVLAGGILYRNGNAFLPTAGCFVAVIMMGFAHGSSLLDPQITPLVPVLQSYWLIIHVAIITSSYGFFGLGMVISIFALVLYFFKPTAKIEHTLKELTIVNEMALTIGIFALTIGTFLGGMWANESWGRYWSWDPKETWAFISVIVYAVVLHMRLVPGLRGNFAFNVASLWAISAPIMTYFGVNYYLSGLHTYAAGDKIPIPAWVPITICIFLVLTIASYLAKKRWHLKKTLLR